MVDSRLELFKQWAPPGVSWSQWAKPVLFAFMNEVQGSQILEMPDVSWAKYLGRETAIILDLPGEASVNEALGLSERGFRPVPLYNSCVSLGMLVDVQPVIKALIAGREVLTNQRLPEDAPPVFMLDSRRMEPSGVTAMRRFDNRWSVMPQDMPSAKYLKEAGVTRILVRSDKLRDDLAHILCRYQQEKLEIELCSDGRNSERVTVRRPSLFRSLYYRWSVLSGLKRNSTGGFGAVVPYIEPSSGGGGGGAFFHGARMG